MANQTFKVAGITTHGEVTKVRFTDDLIRRVKQFTKGQASRVDLIELPSAMSKLDALKYLQSHEMFQSPDDQAVISDAIADREPSPKKEKKVKEVKVKVSKKEKPSLDAIKARGKKADVTAEDLVAVAAEQSEAEPDAV
jgi:hypothetical protein